MKKAIFASLQAYLLSAMLMASTGVMLIELHHRWAGYVLFNLGVGMGAGSLAGQVIATVALRRPWGRRLFARLSCLIWGHTEVQRYLRASAEGGTRAELLAECGLCGTPTLYRVTAHEEGGEKPPQVRATVPS